MNNKAAVKRQDNFATNESRLVSDFIGSSQKEGQKAAGGPFFRPSFLWVTEHSGILYPGPFFISLWCLITQKEIDSLLFILDL